MFGCIVCFQALSWACSSRLTPTGAAVPPTPDPRSEPASTAPAPTAIDPTPGFGDCALVPDAGESIGTVALGDQVEASNAPRPSNDSERLLFRQLYETLVRVDCHGRVGPGLAASWRLGGDGRTWIVTLREGARFSNDAPVTAADVRASLTSPGSGDDLPAEVNRLVHSITVIDDQTLAITLQHRGLDTPVALAHPDLAIAKPVVDSPWPLGTRSRRIAPEGDTQVPRAVTLSADARTSSSAIRLLVASGDLRDVLDGGVDLLLARDPAVLDYAATLPQFQSVPLAWQRVYVLVTPARSRSSPSLLEDARQALADEAVRGEAQGARAPFWWQMLPDCEVPHPQARGQSVLTPRIVYDAGDAAARDLAERFVGLVRAANPATTALLDALFPDRPRRMYERATGLTGEALAAARRRGTDAGYIMSLDNRPVDACRDLQMLVDGARWLDPETIVPLVETRRRAIVRRGRSGVTAEWDGGLLIAGSDER